MSSPNRWLVRLHAGSHAVARLLCFPYAGGSASAFADWGGKLGNEIETWAVQLPARGRRFSEPPIDSFDQLLPVLRQALAFPDSLPLVLFGHSLGALVAFEVARSLGGKTGVALKGLIVSGANAPQRPRDRECLHRLDDCALIDRLAAFGGTPPELLANRDLMELVLPALRADFALFESYRYIPQPRLGIPLAVFGGGDDSGVPEASLDAWRWETSAACSVDIFDGGHFFINGSVDTVLPRLRSQILAWAVTPLS